MLISGSTPALVQNMSNSRTTGTQEDTLATRARAESPAPAAALPDAVSTEHADVIAESKRRMEQDVTYQILRHTFKLEEQTQDAAPPQPAAEISTDLGGLQVDLGAQADAELAVQWEASSSLQVQGQWLRSAGSIELTREGEARLSVSLTAEPAQQVDPLVLDLGGQGIMTTGVDDGVIFDMTGDVRLEQVSFVAGDSWFLALDRNNNGRIDDGRELFGDQNGAANGFDELAKFDDNGDGVINAEDSVFARLQLFRMDADGTQHLKSLEDAGVKSIDLSYRDTAEALNRYDVIAQLGQFEFADGRTGTAGDVLLGYRSMA